MYSQHMMHLATGILALTLQKHSQMSQLEAICAE